MKKTLQLEDLSAAEVPIKINGVNYIALEANGTQAQKFRDALIPKSAKINSDGRIISADVDDLKGIQHNANVLLLSMCVVKADNRAPVSAETISEWPDRAIRNVAQLVKDISELDSDSEDGEDPT